MTATKIDLNRADANINEDDLREEVERLFTYAGWSDEQIEHGRQVVAALMNAYETIIKHVPPCPTRTVALRKLTEARMDANSAITHGGRY